MGQALPVDCAMVFWTRSGVKNSIIKADARIVLFLARNKATDPSFSLWLIDFFR
jgi:hypothetical protein